MRMPKFLLVNFAATLLSSGELSAGTIHEVEPSVKGNTIALDIRNKMPTTLIDMTVSVLDKPEWVNISSADIGTKTLPFDSTAVATVVFDVQTGPRSGEKGDITIAVYNHGSLVAKRTISLMVALPKAYRLDQNYPNPFNPTTTIQYQLPVDGLVTLKVYDVIGREVATLVNEQQKADYYKVALDASRFASGVYFYRIHAGNFVDTKKFLLLR